MMMGEQKRFSMHSFVSDIDLFCFKIGKSYYPQVFLEEHKYIVKEKND